MTLILLSTAWLIGIVAARYVSPPLVLIGLLAIVPIAGLILWREDAKVRRVAACGLFLLLGSLRYTLSLPDLSDPGHIAAYRDQGQVTLWGRVVGEPDVRDTYTNLRLAVDRVLIEGEDHSVIRARAYQAVVAEGTSLRPSNFQYDFLALTLVTNPCWSTSCRQIQGQRNASERLSARHRTWVALHLRP